MVGMHVSDDQGANAVERKLDDLVISPRAEWRCISTLEQPAVDQHAAVLRHMQLVAGAGYTVLGAVMGDMGVFHQLVL